MFIVKYEFFPWEKYWPKKGAKDKSSQPVGYLQIEIACNV
jgi:hypothetical protein